MKSRYIVMMTSALALLSMTLVSCVNEISEPETGHVEGCDEVSVCLNLTLGRETNGTPETKSIDDPSDYHDTEIKNLCILQFAGTDDDARLVGDVHYISEYTGGDIKLADSHGEEHTIVILANTFTRIPGVETLGEMLHLTRRIEKPADLFGHTGQAEDFPNDTDYYQRLNGLAVTEVKAGTEIKATLKRSFARINIKITNTGADDLRIKSVKLCKVPMKDYYISDYSYPDPSGGAHVAIRDIPFHDDDYDVSNPLRMDYPEIEWENGIGTFECVQYMPCNMRGVINNDDPKLKNRFSPSEGATYLEVLGGYGPEHDMAILFTFYLGANLINDFNISPNTVYNYLLSFTGIGDVAADTRIQDYGGKDFDMDANCYMLKIPKAGTASYSFNVVHRPNTFWGMIGGDRYRMQGDDYMGRYSNNFIDENRGWYARIIWSDFAMTQDEAKSFLADRDGSGGGSYMSECQRVTVNIPADHPGGNVLIGVYEGYLSDEEANPTLLWSWHLWITDYDPDAICGNDPLPGKYIYAVPGGEVHRYGGSTWTESGRYAKSYAMDRYVGAMGQATPSPQRAMAYQEGRKDPFCPRENDGRAYDKDSLDPVSVPKTSFWFGYDISRTYIDSNYGTDRKNVPWSINNPDTYIAGSSMWTNDGFFTAVTSTWNDPTCSKDKNIRQNPEETGGIEYKSIFDPCPPGWRVPNGNCYEGIPGNVEYCNDATKGKGKGAIYYPLGKGNKTQAIFFPAYGPNHDYGGIRIYTSENDNYNNEGNGNYLEIGTSGSARIYKSRDSKDKSLAYVVRCVLE